MKSLPNIEPSGFRRGEYVGYAAGAVWKIKRVNSRRWEAITCDPLQLPGDEKPQYYISGGRTLEEVSAGLTRFHRRHV